jgi:hypothetical protein
MKKFLHVLSLVILLVGIAEAQPITWTQLQNARPFAWAGNAVLGNYFYNFGCTTTSPVAQAFNLTTEHWETSTQPPFGWRRYGNAATDNAIYLIGWDAFPTQFGANVQKFTPSGGGPTGTWTQMASYPLPICALAAAWDGGNYIYTAGGVDETTIYSLAFRYDITNNTWMQIANLPLPMYGPGGAFIQGRFYVVGGVYTPTTLVEYNPNDNTWTFKTNPPQGIPGARPSVTSNGYLLFTVGGGLNNAPSDAVQVYNPLTDTWTQETPLPEPTAVNSACFVPPNKVISAGGFLDPGIVLSTTYSGMGFPTNMPNLEVNLAPINPPIVIPANGGTFSFNVFVERTIGPQAPYVVWARIKNPNGTYTAPTLGPVTINTPVGVTITRQRSQTVPGSWAAGLYTYLGYANTTFSYPAVDSSSFTWTKSATAGGGPFVSEAICDGEPFPGEMTVSQPVNFALMCALPNPFNPTTTISYELRAAGHVSLKVYDTAGRLVATLVDGWREAGTHRATFDGSNLASGIYLAKLEAGSNTATQKLVLMK